MERRKAATQFYLHFTVDSLQNSFKPGVYFLPASRELVALIPVCKPADRAAPDATLRNTLNAKRLCYECLCGMPPSSLTVARYSSRIACAMETMTANLKRPFSNEALAQTAGMSVNAFIRLFEQEAGAPPQKWTMERRINQASLMLSHGDKSIDEIAELTGFCDRAHFSRVFSSFKQCGPSAYRKRSLPQR